MKNVLSLFSLILAIAICAPAHAASTHGGKYLSLPSNVISGDSAVVSWKGTPGNQQDWVTVVKAGTADTEWGKWSYTAGKKDGHFTATGLTAGDYEARLYFDYPNGGFKVIERIAFKVEQGPPKGKYLSLTAAEFKAGSMVIVTWFNTPGNQQDWVTVVKADQPDTEWGQWTYTKGKKSGKFFAKNLTAGAYDVRLYFNYPDGGFAVKERLKFTVK